jgi:Helix-turn-helix domain
MKHRTIKARPLWKDSLEPRGTRTGNDMLRDDIRAIVDVIDTTEPAWPGIAAVLREFVAAGIELDVPTAGMAVKLGRQRWGSGGDRTVLAQKTLASSAESIVYYIRRGAHIKIGTTRRPRHRFTELMPDEIMAIEPGGRPEEAARHAQFAHLRVRALSEYFHDSPDLLDHIRDTRSMYGDPDPSWPTMTKGREQWCLPLASSTDALTTEDAEKQLGINPVTVRAWRHHGRIEPAGIDHRGRFLFYREHLIRLRDSPHQRMSEF